MGKSKGNFITLRRVVCRKTRCPRAALFAYDYKVFHPSGALQKHLDFSNEALQAAEKGLKRLMQAVKDVASLRHSADAPLLPQVTSIKEDIYTALLDDMNTPMWPSLLSSMQ